MLPTPESSFFPGGADGEAHRILIRTAECGE